MNKQIISNKKRMLLTIVTVMLLLACASLASAARIDLAGPDNNIYTNQQEITVDFYVDLDNTTNATTNTTECSLLIDDAINITGSDMNAHGLNEFATSLSQGAHLWSINCTDELGQMIASEQRNITVDTINPNIIPIFPDDNTQINSSSVEFRFIVVDNPDESLDCTILMNNSMSQSLSAIDSQIIITNISGVSDGRYSWTMSCTDLAGNQETSATRYFAVSATPPPPVFSINIEKPEYNIGESGLMNISAPNSTSIRVEVCPVKSGFVECKIPVNAQNVMNYPFSVYLPYTNYEGKYHLEAYFNYSRTGIVETKIISYEVKNNIAIDVDISKNPRQNELVELEADATGGVGHLNYSWQLSNGHIVNSSKANITYTSAGNYTEKIFVKDEYNNTKNQSISINASNSVAIIVIIKDAITNAVIPGATVEIEDEQKTADSNGQVNYHIKPGKKDILILKENYSEYNGELNITKDETFTILLNPKNTAQAKVTLLRPGNNTVISGPTNELVFKVEHIAALNCSVYINENNDGFYIYLGSRKVTDSSENVFGVTDLENKTYWWNVECADTHGNRWRSDTWMFTVGSAQQVAASQSASSQSYDESSGYTDWVKEFEQLAENVKNLPQEEQAAAIAFGIDKSLEDSIKIFKNTIRDIDSLRFRNDLTDEQKEAERENIVTKAEEAYQKAPIGIELLGSEAYIDYINPEELSQFVSQYLNLSNSTKIINQKKALKFITELQQEAVISSKIMSVNINYRDGTSKEMSAVLRDIKTYNLTQGTFIAEIIPKTVAESTDELTSQQDYEVLLEDPIIKFNLKGDAALTYYVNKKVDLEELKKIKTAVMIEPANIPDDQVTGFAVSNLKLPKLKGVMFIPLVIILGGLLFVGVRSDGIHAARYVIYRINSSKHLHYINVVLDELHDNLQAGDVNKAFELYNEAKVAYDDLPTMAKNDIHEKVTEAASKIEDYHTAMYKNREADALNSQIQRLEGLLSNAQLIPALETYKSIESTYHQLDEQTRETFHPALVNVGNRIQILINNTRR